MKSRVIIRHERICMDYRKKFDDLLDTVIKEGASDLHIAPGRTPVIRVSGYLIPLTKKEIVLPEESEAIIKSLLSEEKYQIFLSNREIDFSWSHKGGNRFRCNAYFHGGVIGIAMRFIPKHVKGLLDLNLPPVLETFVDKQQGFFIVVGPVGHGKTTTLASMIEMINERRSEHIITIEDPIEYVYEPKKSVIDQREVGSDTKGFHEALSAAFRQDVDVILIGEMRDPETISAAVTAAETGHLVFSTLHTNNAAQTIDRILDSFPANQQGQIRGQLAGCLAGIFSQRLVPRISGGLIPAYELLISNNAVSNLIRDGRVHEINTVIETGLEQGMLDLNRSLAELTRAGEITADNARSYSFNPKGLDRII